jgi:hypothetical protein
MPPASNPERDTVLREIGLRYRKFRRGSKGWTAAYHFSIFGSAGASAAAALVVKIGGGGSTNAAAILAGSAALLTSVNVLGGFRQKWLADRDAWYALDVLQINAPELGDDDLRQKFVEIIGRQRSSWVEEGGSSSASASAN